MIEIQQGEQPSGTLERLMRQLADARRDLHATKQALSERDAELERCRPMSEAAHAYCALLLSNDMGSVNDASRAEAFNAMLDAHRATTPSKDSP